MAQNKDVIAVTGASGKLGRLVLDGLLQTVPGGRLVAIARNPEKLSDFAARGVNVRQGDYDKPESLASALSGVTLLLLISGSDIGQRGRQHEAVIAAAKEAGVGHVVYTSLLRTDTSTILVAGEHKATELALEKSGLSHTILRNGWYMENYTENLATPLAMGAFVGSAGSGRIAAATRNDLAAAAVRVLTEERFRGKTYELVGDTAFTMADLAAAVSKWAGKTIPYNNLTPAEYENALNQAGMPAMYVHFFVTSDAAILKGDLDSSSRDLHTLIGRDTESLQTALSRVKKP